MGKSKARGKAALFLLPSVSCSILKKHIINVNFLPPCNVKLPIKIFPLRSVAAY